MFAESETKFFIKERPGQIFFVKDANRAGNGDGYSCQWTGNSLEETLVVPVVVGPSFQWHEHRAAYLDAAIAAGPRQELHRLDEVVRVDVLAEAAP